MLKKNNKDYYSKMKELSVLIFNEYDLIRFAKCNNENDKELFQKIYLEKLYNILLDIVNQVIYDNINEFSSDDIEFIVNFEIDKILPDIINLIHKNINIKKLKKENKKEQKRLKK